METIQDRLTVLEQKMDKLLGIHELLQEMIKKDLYRNVQPLQVVPFTATTPTNYYFHITDIYDYDNTLTCFEISGKTFDIRDKLKEFDNTITFVKERKSWKFLNFEKKDEVVNYLKTLTTDIKYKELVLSQENM